MDVGRLCFLQIAKRLFWMACISLVLADRGSGERCSEAGVGDMACAICPCHTSQSACWVMGTMAERLGIVRRRCGRAKLAN